MATLCIFNPEHDLCLANGDANYVPPRSALEFACRDASLMQVLYPCADRCCSAYDLASKSEIRDTRIEKVIAWGWDAVVKHELKKRGVSETLLPTDDYIDTIRRLQHRSTILPLQPDCRPAVNEADVKSLLRDYKDLVMKAPWSGAGRGLRWVRGELTAIDCDWLKKTVASQQAVIVEPRREVQADVALEYTDGQFIGYSYFKTGGGVYRENVKMTDDAIENTFRHTQLKETRTQVERWLAENIWTRYHGPLGVDLMVCKWGKVHVAEMNLRHTMGMVAHVKNNRL